MGHKKNKRGSITGTASPTSSKTELIERTPENDYGVLSDPEEGTELNENKNQHEQELQQHPQHPQQSPILNDNSVPISEPQSSASSAFENDTYSPQQKHSSPQPHTPLTQSPTLQPSPSLTLSLTPPSSQQAQSPPSPSSPSSPQSLTLSGRLTPSLPPPSPGTKSLKALQLKLTTDKNYSKKITLHTFFSYVVLAIEIERASSSSIARISAANVEKLVMYLIDNHAANKDIETYLNALLTTDVIRNLIAAVLEFNTDQADALDKLLSTEQMEMEMMALKAAATTAAPDATAAAASTASTAATTNATHDNQSPLNASTTPTPQLSQTSRAKRFWNFLKCLLCGCCGGGGAPQRRELRSIDQQASP